MSSRFRFVAGGKRDGYSVWRGETWLGHVTKNAHRFRGKTYEAGWVPTLPSGQTLATEPKREAAAEWLWKRRNEAADWP